MPGKCEDFFENVNEFVRNRKFLFCGLICALILVAFTARLVKYYSSSSAQSPYNGTWNHLLFAQSWPVSYCKVITGKEKNPVDVCNLPKNETWMIHGLWPNNKSKGPKYCLRTRLNVTELEPIRDQLEQYWVTTVKNMTISSFWEYEWLKHGTCGFQNEQLNTQLKYFNRSLELYKQYNVTKALNECGIHPDDSKLHKYSELANCFQKHFKVDPQITCTKVDKKQLLSEVRFCINKDLNVKNCRIFGIEVKYCKGDFIYPANAVPKI